jgi:hypothetical protein
MTVAQRITVAFSDRRGLLEPILKKERKQYPKANVKLDGAPGRWRVRRDRVESDPADHQARDLRRYRV